MSTVANAAPPTLTCPHRGHPVGFAAAFGAVSEVTVSLSCGCRLPTSTPVTLSPFRATSPLTATSCDPVRQEVRRGPLATTPVFYTRTGDVVCVSTLPGPRGSAAPAAVGAMLLGQPLPSPLTPWSEVFRLAAGTVLQRAEGGRVRLALETLDWRELLPKGFRRVEPRDLVRAALVDALADAPADCVALSGGPASTLLTVLADLPARHVAVRLPLLDRRAEAVAGFGLPRVEVVDGTARWEALRDGPVLPEQSDPWPDVVTSGSERVVSGYGLGLLLAAAGRPDRPRRRHLLAGEQVSPALWGKSFFVRRLPASGGHDAPPEWLGRAALTAVRTAQAATATSHLVPKERADQALVPVATQVIALLEGCGLSRIDGAGRRTPLLPGLHPAVVGAAVALAARGRSLRLADLLPVGWRPADPPVGGRDRLFAAAYVRDRLATPAAHADLLHRLGDGDWVRKDELAAVLARPGARLAHSWLLHRVHALAVAHPELFTGREGGS